MAASRKRRGGVAPDDTRVRLHLSERGSVYKRGPRGVKRGVADADKIARTGSATEPVRNAPPAGAWNDVAAD